VHRLNQRNIEVGKRIESPPRLAGEKLNPRLPLLRLDRYLSSLPTPTGTALGAVKYPVIIKTNEQHGKIRSRSLLASAQHMFFIKDDTDGFF